MTKVSDPLTINGMTVKNRLTFAPTVKFDYAGEDGRVTEKHVKHYTERARGGLGLICVEATAVTPEGRFAKNHLGLWEDGQTEGHKAITEACHDQGTVVLIQLNHTGITGNPIFGTPVGPSAVTVRDGSMSHAMSIEEIHEMQDSFVSAALRAKKAGYDGIQLHGCHGYLINQFVSPKTNLRDDEYGADKALFAAEIIKKIRSECGDRFIISIRTTGAEPDAKSAIKAAREYVDAGCDYLQVSHGIDSFTEKLKKEGEPYSDLAALGVNMHKAMEGRVPVSCVGGLLTPEPVRYMIENGLTDTVDLARGVLADPNFANAVLNDTAYTKCFECERCQYGPGTKHVCPAELKRQKAMR
ncbi:MAG: NADH:flavin oxidoreductase [Lachnospiraceae bacterium]|nr:NADH:flavin oxidoreductase [Lachnospiraceae bacterium]